ncbi:S1 RNA-binding domain-containing protein [Candidatus Gracilibacteria bacterium]|nr:S1 RNA-binding domain-containing protein [Candidatus Gracilibacteria bacterium]
MLLEPNYLEIISNELSITQNQVLVVLEMIKSGDTIPFIARYRKEITRNLDEIQIKTIIDLEKKIKNLYEAKFSAINNITEAGKMTPDLLNNLINAKTLKEVEEIYKPYKSKKKTKAMIALEKGFKEVSDLIKLNKSFEIPKNLLSKYTEDEIISGAIDIISSEISLNTILRELLITEYKKYGIISSSKKTPKSLEKLNDKDREQIPKFELYFENSLKIQNIKPYQILALNRGESLGILNVRLEKDEIILDKLRYNYSNILNINSPFLKELETAFLSGYDTLFSSIENEIRSDLTDIGEDDSILIFEKNLFNLLMSKPENGKKVLAIDPGFKAGCKLCVLDELGNPIHFDKIFLHSLDNAKTILKDIILKYKIDVVVIGNGTGSNEAQDLVKEVFSKDIFIVNESGASVYSAGEIAQDEFPDIDVLDRGTISIGRRFIDPLSELVKVPVGSIGVGMYQHDITQKKLEEKLSFVVEMSVNEVGINVNQASIYLLGYISGIDKRQAKKIYQNRPYRSREELKKVLGEKAYTQAIGFLRVPESEEKFDNSDIHPDQYLLAKYLIENNLKKIDSKSKELFQNANQDTVDFIWDSYKNLGIEKRVVSTFTKASKKVVFEELKIGDILEGTIRNVVAFGAFVDVGLKNDGLVHVSQIADAFVKDPNDFVAVGDKVRVKITQIDEKINKLQLSMKI